MSDGSSRQRLAARVFLVLVLAMLAGCSTWFGPPPLTPAQDPDLNAMPLEQEALEPASEPQASAPAAASAPREAPERKRVAPRPVYHPPRRPQSAPPPPPAKPAAPPPLIATRALADGDTHGLLDARVQRPDGKVIGRAIDMLVDTAGKPREMLVRLAGFMGIGDRKMRFPWSDFRFDPKQRTVPITLSIGPNEAPAAASSKAKENGSGAGANDARLLGIIDATAERANGERVGRVVDVLLDSHGEPQAAVVDVGSLIHERRSIAADWSALRFVQKEDGLDLQTDLTDAQVNAAPPYTPNQPVRTVAPAAADTAASAGHPTK
ncbi:PRC-barrel domain-containing protein [Trinickia diaoshuihuensis]|uniref:PRC-barrel domain-containing protein n=1 Tax=Trinickia diaoshuihuensis TaxID=2292265 RepID=UPI0013C3360F|nr:PRC-barrel domain-containing protein [Trinickia diaoshuihuensis]